MVVFSRFTVRETKQYINKSVYFGNSVLELSNGSIKGKLISFKYGEGYFDDNKNCYPFMGIKE